MQHIIPYLGYADAPRAIEFLCRAFGFEERSRYPMPDGRVGHAELSYRGSVLMLASAYPELGLVSARDLPAQHAQIACVVDDVDAHYERARSAGATVVAEPEEQHGQRMYRALDCEGHKWIFSAPLSEPDAKESSGR